MKKRYLTYAVALSVGMQLFSACSDDFLEVKPKGLNVESNYYRNQQEAFNGVLAVYDAVGWSDGLITKVGAMNSASDDFKAGGGGANDIAGYQLLTDYSRLTPAQGPQENLWRKGFSGIFRANVL